uniref:Uncharacterized protein n=1 Tax=Pseudomonas phage HRDY3 TaxID=3236930 RepID=A0AB39CEB5_9VIRU
MAVKKGSGVKVRTVRGGDDDDGIVIDRKGKPRNSNLDEGRGPGIKKKKKIKPKEREDLTPEDNTFKVGKDPLKKKKKKAIEGDYLPKASNSKELAMVSAGPVALKKKAKGKQDVLQAVEEYVHLPQPVDEFDAETRRIFEQLVRTAGRLEDQMEERIYNKDVYALNTIYSQIREVIADLRATRDISAQISELEAVVLRPYQQIVAQGFTDMYFHMMGAITKFVKDEDIRAELEKKMKNTLGEVAETVTEEYPKALDRMRKVLL